MSDDKVKYFITDLEKINNIADAARRVVVCPNQYTLDILRDEIAAAEQNAAAMREGKDA